MLVSSSSFLLLWNLVGFELSAFEGGPLGVLGAIPKGVVPFVLIVVIVYQAYCLFRDSRLLPPAADNAFLLGVDTSVVYLIAATAVLSFLSRLTAGELLAAIQLSPTCLVFAGFGWTLVIPSAYALWSSGAQVFSHQGLKIIGPAMLVCGVLAIWIAT